MAINGELKLKLYNTMTKTVEFFEPIEPGKVGMYVCGVTPYDFSHLGHARAAVCFDVLYRYLKYLGYDVTYVRNFTDIDDKIIRRAHETGEKDPFSLSDRFCKNYLEDMDDLQCLRPTHEPRVSKHMKQITDMITQIKNNGCAYDVDGDVYFAVKKAKNYGVLSGQKLGELKPGERIAVDLRKDHPADFALWKAAKPGEPSWDWESQTWESSVNQVRIGPAPGRPGWHIECSAMSAQYLTHKFDIHGGGRDLIFPHHENEIAQSCAACQDSHVNYWLHNGHVTNNNVKMSKSLGNFFTIREITKRYHPLALRHFLISADYRSPLNYTVMQLEHSSDAVFKIYQALQNCKDAFSLSQDATVEGNKGNAKPAQVIPAAQDCISKLHTDFLTKLSEDLSTSHILIGTCFQDALTLINTYCKSLQKKMQKQLKLSTMQSLVELEEQVKEVLDILGLLSPLAYSEVLQQLKGMALKRAGLKEDELSRLIEKRAEAKIVRDYETSDKIRADLETKGVALMDNDARIWRPCIPAEQKQQIPPESA